MASSINADNGVVSGSSGVKTTADTSGVLALQSNGSTGLTLNTSLAVGVGSSPSYGTSGQVLTSAGSSAAPTWTTLTPSIVGATPFTTNISQEVTFSAGTSVTYFGSRRITLDANREMLILGGTTSANIYAIVYDSSTSTFGSPVTVRTNVAMCGAILAAADKVLVVSCTGTSTNLEAVILSVSTNTITVNTAATATLAGNIRVPSGSSYFSLVAVGSSFVFSYTRATTVKAIRALTVSSNTVTIGAETVVDSTANDAPYLIAYSASVVMCVYQASSLLNATPYTISGTTITAGTSATTTFSGVSSNWQPIGAFQSGQIGILYSSGASATSVAVISLSGTTALISTVVAISEAYSAAAFIWALVGNQVIVSYSGSVNVVTNTAGTASAGAQNDATENDINGAIFPNYIIINGGNTTTKFSISGSNPLVQTISGYAINGQYATANLLRTWDGTSMVVRFLAVSATKAGFPYNSFYTNLDGTPGFTNPLAIGNDAVLGGTGASLWAIQLISSTAGTYLLSKVTIS